MYPYQHTPMRNPYINPFLVDIYGLKKSPIVGEQIRLRQLGGSKIGAPPGVGTLGSLGETNASEAGRKSSGSRAGGGS